MRKILSLLTLTMLVAALPVKADIVVLKDGTKHALDFTTVAEVRSSPISDQVARTEEPRHGPSQTQNGGSESHGSFKGKDYFSIQFQLQCTILKGLPSPSSTGQSRGQSSHQQADRLRVCVQTYTLVIMTDSS